MHKNILWDKTWLTKTLFKQKHNWINKDIMEQLEIQIEKINKNKM